MHFVDPSPSWKREFLDLTRDHAESGEPRYELAIEDFGRYLQKLQADAKPHADQPSWVPHSEFWLEDEGTIIGVARRNLSSAFNSSASASRSRAVDMHAFYSNPASRNGDHRLV